MIPVGLDVAKFLHENDRRVASFAFKQGIRLDDARALFEDVLCERGHEFNPAHSSGASLSTFIFSKFKWRLFDMKKRAAPEVSLDSLVEDFNFEFAAPDFSGEQEEEEQILVDREVRLAADPALFASRLGILPPLLRDVAQLIVRGLSFEAAAQELGKSLRQVEDLFEAAVRVLLANPGATQPGLF